MPVIYKITNPSGSVYIGQSKNFKKRLACYKCVKHMKSQAALHRSFLKYGFENHAFEIVMENIDISDMNAYELLYMDFYKHMGFKMLNIAPGGSKAGAGKWTEERREHMRKIMTGRTFSPESCRKMSVAQSNRTAEHKANNLIGFLTHGCTEKQKAHHLKEGKRLAKNLIQYSMDGKIINEFESVTIAAKKLNVNRSNISNCARGDVKSSLGFIWKYKN